MNFTRDYPCLFSSVFFFRCTFCPFCYPMSFLLQLSSFVVPFARSVIPCLFSSVFFFRCTFCPFCYPISFLLQFSSFVVPFARSVIPYLFFFSFLRSSYLLPVLLSHAFFFFSSLRSSNTLNTSAVIQDFLTALRLPRISLAVSVTAEMKVLIGVSTSTLSTSSVVGEANLPPIITWKATTSSRSLSTHFYLL